MTSRNIMAQGQVSIRSLGPALVNAMLVFSCSGEDLPPRNQVDVQKDPPTDDHKTRGIGTACMTGAVEACSIKLGTRDGIADCAPGYRVCSDERWGACEPATGFGTTSARSNQRQ